LLVVALSAVVADVIFMAAAGCCLGGLIEDFVLGYGDQALRQILEQSMEVQEGLY